MIIIRVEIEYLVGAHRAWTKDMKSYEKYACRVYIQERIYLFYILKRALFEQDAASGIILLLAFKALYIYIYASAVGYLLSRIQRVCVTKRINNIANRLADDALRRAKIS